MAFEIRSFNLRDVKGLSQAALNLHLDLYHGYVEQVNTLLEVLQPQESPSRTPALTREAAVRRFPFEYNGMVLHELFFEQLSGSKGRPPHEQGPLGQAVGHAFGGFDGWRKDFEKLAATRGVGWVMTVREQIRRHVVQHLGRRASMGHHRRHRRDLPARSYGSTPICSTSRRSNAATICRPCSTTSTGAWSSRG